MVAPFFRPRLDPKRRAVPREQPDVGSLGSVASVSPMRTNGMAPYLSRMINWQ